MDGLGVLQALDQLHLEFLHLGHLVHLDVPKGIFFGAAFLVVSLRIHLLSPFLLFDLHLSKSLRLQADLVFHFVFLLDSEHILPLLLFILLLDHLGLLGLFLLLQEEGVLDLSLLVVSLLRQHVVVLAHLPLLLLL